MTGKPHECSSRCDHDDGHQDARPLPQDESLKSTLRVLVVRRGLVPAGFEAYQLSQDEMLGRLEAVIPGIRRMTMSQIRALEGSPDLAKRPTLRLLTHAFGITRPTDIAQFQLSREQLTEMLEPVLPGVAGMAESQLQEILHKRQTDGALPYKPRASLLVSSIEGIREEEPGFLKGTMYVQGRLFHAQFIRVKYRNTDPEASGEFNEDGDGEQGPWNDDPNSLCSQWWHSTMVHVDDCVFAVVQVPPFEGHYALLIHPGSA